MKLLNYVKQATVLTSNICSRKKIFSYLKPDQIFDISHPVSTGFSRFDLNITNIRSLVTALAWFCLLHQVYYSYLLQGDKRWFSQNNYTFIF